MLIQSWQPEDTTLAALCDAWRLARGDTIVFTNGCFDLLHPGHMRLLREARDMGDRLIVAVNSDDSVRRLKGADRPRCNEQRRLTDLMHHTERAGIKIDALVVFGEDTPAALVEAVRPDVLVKGGDWEGQPIAGADHAGRVVLVPRIGDYSTTAQITAGVALPHDLSAESLS